VTPEEEVKMLEEVDPIQLGARIRTARKAALLTQAQVAADDVTGAYLSRVEDGQRRPAYSLLCDMAERMGTTVGWLLTGVHDDARMPRALTQLMERMNWLETDNVRLRTEVLELRARLHHLEEVVRSDND
jgi:transcriptional regulator with XRE-family HTH domain